MPSLFLLGLCAWGAGPPCVALLACGHGRLLRPLPNHRLRLPQHRKLENIRPRVVTRDVEHPAWTSQRLGIDLGVEDAFLLVERPGDEFAFGIDDRAVSRVD